MGASSDDSGLPSYDTAHIIAPSATAPPNYDGTVRPRPADASRTAHTYSLNPNPNTDVTLTLNGSHAPSAAQVPLFFIPDTIDGEVTIDLKKTTTIKKISVYLQGQRLLTGTRVMEIVPGEPGQKGVFWESESPNLLYASGGEVAASPLENEAKPTVDVGPGAHNFKFSFTVPETYKKAKSQGAVGWAKSLFGSTSKQPPEYEDLPLPPSTLDSVQRVNPQLHQFQYSVWVSVETGPLSNDYKFSKRVVVLSSRTQSVDDSQAPPSPTGDKGKSTYGNFMPTG